MKKKKLEKNLPTAQETLSTSFGPFLCSSSYDAVSVTCAFRSCPVLVVPLVVRRRLFVVPCCCPSLSQSLSSSFGGCPLRRLRPLVPVVVVVCPLVVGVGVGVVPSRYFCRRGSPSFRHCASSCLRRWGAGGRRRLCLAVPAPWSRFIVVLIHVLVAVAWVWVCHLGAISW
jgi:hypothetical protein